MVAGVITGMVEPHPRAVVVAAVRTVGDLATYRVGGRDRDVGGGFRSLGGGGGGESSDRYGGQRACHGDLGEAAPEC